VSGFDAKAFVTTLPARPGVYRILDLAGEILYVGKARNLRARVGSYFRPERLQPRVQALVRLIAGVEVTVTSSETEALLLEHNLIKRHRPRFNVILRDDKSFPWLHLSAPEFPRHAPAAGAAVWPVSIRGRGARDPEPAASPVPAARLPGQLFLEPEPALPRVPDPPLLGALHRADHGRGLCRGRAGGGAGARGAGRRRHRTAWHRDGGSRGPARL
jgi:hypothetical protein